MKDEASTSHPKVEEIRTLSMWSEAQVSIILLVEHSFFCVSAVRACRRRLDKMDSACKLR